MAEKSFCGGPQRLVCGVTEVRPQLQFRPQDVGDARAAGNLPRRAAHREQTNPREKNVYSSKAGRAATSHKEVENFGVCPAGFHTFFALGFSLHTSIPPF